MKNKAYYKDIILKITTPIIAINLLTITSTTIIFKKINVKFKEKEELFAKATKNRSNSMKLEQKSKKISPEIKEFSNIFKKEASFDFTKELQKNSQKAKKDTFQITEQSPKKSNPNIEKINKADSITLGILGNFSTIQETFMHTEKKYKNALCMSYIIKTTKTNQLEINSEFILWNE